MKTEILATKITGNYKLAAVKRTHDDGHVHFGFSVARAAGRWRTGWGYDERQVMRLVRKHNCTACDPNVLIFG